MQGVQYMDFLKEGNFGVFGSSQTGKTSLLRTIATSLCRMYSPRDIHLYIIADMAGMEAFPQVGGVGIRTGRKAWQAHKYADQFSGGEKKNFQSGESGFSESLPGTGQ